jgi:hypothetical protein
MKKTHEKQIHEYNEADHFHRCIWHLRRMGIADSAFRYYEENLTFLFNVNHKKTDERKT